MKLLVTGSTGFIGSYFIDYALFEKKDILLHGFFSSSNGPFNKSCTYHRVDLRERDNTISAIREISPDYIIHFAGVNTGSADEFLNSNVIGLVNLLDSIVLLKKKIPTVVIGSSAEYGYQGDNPIKESAPLCPVGFYGISKATATLTAQSYSIKFGLPVTVARPFNVTGPGQSSNFICGKVIFQILEIHAGKRESIELTGRESYRDFIDVRDVVKACFMLLMHDHFDKGVSGKIFNIGSGKKKSLSEIIHITEKITNKNYKVKFSSNSLPEYVPSQMSDNNLITSTIGWKPEISLKRSLQDMLDHETSD